MKWFIFCLFPFFAITQTPSAFNFQTIVRDKDGKVLSQQELGIKISILRGSESGMIGFSETHATKTNDFGLTNLMIGRGSVITGSLGLIQWSDDSYFLKVEMDPEGGTNYSLSSTQSMLAVPYALYSENTNLKAGDGITLSNNIITALDSSALNELQTITINNNQLTLSKGGGTVTIPTGSLGDNWGNQVVVTTPSLKGNGTAGNPLDLENESIRSVHIQNGTILKEDISSGVITDYTAGNGVSIQNGVIQNTGDLENSNEIQNISLSNNVLSLSKGGGTVTLPTGSGPDNWGTQVVITNSTMKGNGTTASPLDLENESVRSVHIQNGSVLKEDIANGVIPDYMAGNGIAIQNGVIQNTGDLSTTNEFQNLSYDANERKLSISNGNTIQFPALNLSKISDIDGNTSIDAEKTVNDDKIRFNLAGDEVLVIRKNFSGNSMLHFTKQEKQGGNLFIGEEAGIANSLDIINLKGYANTFVGQLSGAGNLSGFYNTSLGYRSLNLNTTGNDNVAVGFNALSLGTDSKYNVAVGSRALMNFISGNNNVAVGHASLGVINGGSNNIAIGSYAQAFAKKRSYTIAIGDSSLMVNGFDINDVNKAIDNLAIGSKSMYSNTMGSENLAIGNQTLFYNISGDRNTTVGLASMFSNISGHSNTGLGYHALFANETGHSNVAIGTNSLSANFEGFGNVAIGSTAMFGNTGGNFNTAIGTGAMFSNESGTHNVAVGFDALSGNTLGINNVAMGTEAMRNSENGAFNICLGSFTLYDNTSGSLNTAIGHYAGGLGTLNQNCTYLGNDSKNSTSASYSNSTAIGANSRLTANNQVRIGDPNVASIGGYKAWSNLSDARYKQDIREDVRGLDFILKLRPVTYQIDISALEESLGIRHTAEKNGINTTEVTQSRQTGFIAQEVEAAGKEIQYNFSGVDKPQNNKDFYGLRYAEFVVPLVKAVQEQQEMINKQQKIIDHLLIQMEALEVQIANIKKN